jgi:ADP-ribose pyrophosphatase YjhB (NUDIX family)
MAKYPYKNDRDLISRALIIKNDAILVNQNVNRKTGEAYVALPGGHVDPGEDCKTALLREIEEELDAHAEIGDLIFVSENIYAGRSKEDTQRHELTLIFAGEISGETSDGVHVRSPEDDKNFRWLPVAELQQANLLPANVKDFLIQELLVESTSAPNRYNFTDTTR